MDLETRTQRLCRFGSHRVLEPAGALPQNAWRLDASPVAFDNEILCDVELLNLDSASFHQIAEACAYDPARVAEVVRATVAERGKQHNAVTGSGGMFVGRVREIGSALRAHLELRPGDRIASLASLTLTPLLLDEILDVDMTNGRLRVRGSAILFESCRYAKLPDDIADGVALAILDVAGAPAQVRRLTKPGQTVAIVGADGKSGILAAVQARARTGPGGRVIGLAPDATTAGAKLLRDHQYVDEFIEADARDALKTMRALSAVAPQLADLTLNCVNVPGTEPASILCTKHEGTIYFFSMCTSFTAAALGAEGMGKDVTMIIGNGYAKDHAGIAFETLRNHPAIAAYFNERYG